jgi:hypothetical protein
MIWVVYAKSCFDCSADAVGVFSHKPTDEEIESVERAMGRPICGTVIVQAVEVDGEPVKIPKER